MRTNLFLKVMFMLFAFATVVACTNDEPVNPNPDKKPDVPSEEITPKVAIDITEVTDTTISFTLIPENLTTLKWLVVEGSTPPTADEVLADGSDAKYNEEATYTATDLKPETEYCVAVVAANNDGQTFASKTATTLKSEGGDPVMPEVTVSLREGSVTESSLSFFISSTEAEVLKWVCVEDGSRDVTAQQVLANGTDAEVNVESEVVVSSLKENTTYAIYAAATCNIDGFVPVLAEKLVIKTLEPEPVGYHLSEGTTAVATKSSSTLDNYFILFNDEASGYTLRADLYTAAGSEYLPSGEYTLGEVAEGALSKSHTSFMFTPADSQMTYFDNGSIKIEATPNEDTREVVYAIEGQLYFENGDFVTLNYNGTIEGIMLPEPLPDNPELPEIPEGAEVFTPDTETKMPECIRTGNLAAGEYYMKFYDENWNELVLDLMLDPAICDNGNAPLPAGTYTMEDGTIDGYSNVYIYSPYYAENFTKAELVVTVDGKEYNMTFIGTAGIGSSERVFYMHYEGEITNMIVE